MPAPDIFDELNVKFMIYADTLSFGDNSQSRTTEQDVAEAAMSTRASPTRLSVIH
jgi:hypothetical protein